MDRRSHRTTSCLLVGAIGFALMALVSGCASDSRSPSAAAERPAAAIKQLVLLGVPATLNVDGLPGPDAFAVRVYASDPTRPKPVAIDRGSLDIMMYDGLISASTNTASLKPLRVWTFTSDNLKPYAFKSSLGVSYRLTLLWGDMRPSKDKITVVARYLDRSGAVVGSAPTIIAVVMN